MKKQLKEIKRKTVLGKKVTGFEIAIKFNLRGIYEEFPEYFSCDVEITNIKSRRKIGEGYY